MREALDGLEVRRGPHAREPRRDRRAPAQRARRARARAAGGARGGEGRGPGRRRAGGANGRRRAGGRGAVHDAAGEADPPSATRCSPSPRSPRTSTPPRSTRCSTPPATSARRPRSSSVRSPAPSGSCRDRSRPPARGAAGRAGRRAEQLARHRHDDVGPAGARAGRAVPRRPLRHARPRRVAGPGRRVHDRRARRATCSACSTTLGIERASIAGVSLGGMTAMALAAAAPERVDRVVLCCTSARLGPPRDVGGARRDRPRRRHGGDRGRDARPLVHARGRPRHGAPLRRDAARRAGAGLRGVLRRDPRHGPARAAPVDRRARARDRRARGSGHAARARRRDRRRHPRRAAASSSRTPPISPTSSEPRRSPRPCWST